MVTESGRGHNKVGSSDLCVGRYVSRDSLQVQFVTVNRPGLVVDRLWCVPGPRLAHTLHWAQHGATCRMART